MPLFKDDERNGEDHPREDRPHNDRSHDNDNYGEREPHADEHSRLLPNRVDSNRGMLRPDDPAVSPYNLWTVRILRYFTVLFTLVTFVWWVLLLVSAFATPPGFHTRGSGFYAFGYACLTLCNMGLTLLFFGVPAKAVRIVTLIMSIVLLLDVILVLAVDQTRYEEGWVGVVSVVWALLMSVWALVADRTVKWGKAEEEERLTGRAETRRSMTEWAEVLISTIAYSIMAAAAILFTMTIVLRALDAGVAPPGKMYWVDSDKYRIHLHCRGNKTDSLGMKLPTVLFEGGERSVEHQLWQFADDAIKHGSISRYCFADRPGLAFSDTAPSPLSAGFAVDVLSEALAKADEHGPWVLASAGIGSIYSRVFASRHSSSVKGMLLIDGLHEDYLDEIGSSSRGFLLWARGVISPLGLDRIPGALFKGRSSTDRIYGRSSNQDGKFIFAKLQESLVAASFTKRDVVQSREMFHKDVPLVIITAGDSIKDDKKWEQKQEELTKLSENLKHWDIAKRAPHEVWETRDGRDLIEKRLKQLTHEF